MFSWLGRVVVRLRWTLIVAALVVVAIGVTWGAAVFGQLTGGGFDDPDSESSRAEDRITKELGPQETDMVVLYSSNNAPVDNPQFRDGVTRAAGRIHALDGVARVLSYYDTQAPQLVSKDRHATYLAITFDPGDDDDAKADTFDDVRDHIAAPGLQTRVGGFQALFHEVSEQVTDDIARAEMLAMPVLLVLLVLIFGSVVAALMPLMIGALAILGSFIVTHLLTLVIDVSIFAINVITILGLGLAIDYGLFVVSRFREEIRAGRTTSEAVRRTMMTAGRTVAVSSLTVALSLAGLLIFPQTFLRSMGMGGIAAVLFAALAALTVLPAVLALLGPRIDAWQIPLPWRSRAKTDDPTKGAWARIARMVMRRPVWFIVGSLALLITLALPFLRVQFGGADERVLPEDAQSRVVAERLASEFPGEGGAKSINVLVSGVDRAKAQQFASEINQLDGVTGTAITAERGDSALVAVSYHSTPTSNEARDVVTDIRALPAPPGAEVMVTGQTAQLVDLLASLGERLPWMAVIVVVVTMVLLFLAFGSLILPIKAVLMNIVSIGASFGVVVWIFQEGHFSDLLGFTPTGDIEATQLILMLAILFGVSMDYEVFLLSRVREQWDRTGDNTLAVATGLQKTGGIITSAALLVIIVVAGFAAGGILFIKMIGVGMIVAIIVDATIVRVLLVPATMRLLGRYNWWPQSAPMRRSLS